jgi:hypothetical protein
MQTEMQKVMEVDGNQDTISLVKRFIVTLGLALVWAFIIAAIVGSFAAAIWTVIPTELLAWGASTTNLLGYVSHCSYAPISTAILSIVSMGGVLAGWKLKRGREIAKFVFIGTAGGLLLGMLGGIDIVMFIGMGVGAGVGVILGIPFGLFRRPMV